MQRYHIFCILQTFLVIIFEITTEKNALIITAKNQNTTALITVMLPFANIKTKINVTISNAVKAKKTIGQMTLLIFFIN